MKDATAEIIGYMLFLACFLIAFFVTGCVQAPIAPNLKLPEPVKECPRLEMPPIAEVCTVYIRGDKIVTDACGDALVRGYVRARSLLK